MANTRKPLATTCPRCDGSGRSSILDFVPCITCEGHGAATAKTIRESAASNVAFMRASYLCGDNDFADLEAARAQAREWETVAAALDRRERARRKRKEAEA